MIENTERLVEVMARAPYDLADDISWEVISEETRQDARADARTGLLAAQADGAEMVSSEALKKLNLAFTGSSGWLTPLNPLRLKGPEKEASKP